LERRNDDARYVKKNKQITNTKYQKLCELSERTALRDLDDLTNKDIFIKKGE
jgi:predicted HTH transcriptional regulator